jgi:hypothetical protein
VKALDRAAKAKALPRRLPVYLTEFGIQSYPDRIAGVPQARQAAYIAIAEHIAYVNGRVASFSQYLMRDDPPVVDGERYGGFESGLRTNAGREKPAYKAFRLPLAVERSGGSDLAWGLVRPDRTATSVTLYAASRKGRFKPLQRVATNSTGVYAARFKHRRGRRYEVRWTAPDGRTYSGPPITAS